MAKQSFSIGQVLEAADMTQLQANDYNWTVSTKTANYTLVAADKGTRVVMNSASAQTITVDDAVFDAGDTVWIHNINTGTCTVTAGTATVNTAGSLALAQWEGGALYFTSASSAIFFRGGSALKYVDFLIVGGGGGGGAGVGGSSNGGGGGGGGHLRAITSFSLSTNYTVTVGAGGASNTIGNDSVAVGFTARGGGRGGSGSDGGVGGSGGGGSGRSGVSYAGAVGNASQGNSGGAGATGTPFRGGGGGGASAFGATGTVSGNGGDGLATTITGSSVTRAGGGGGGGLASFGTGGLGGGANGSGTGTGGNGTTNTGGGGGGSNDSSATGGSGGSGIVVLRYPSTFTITIGAGLTGTTAAVGTDTVATITAGTGNVSWA